MAQKFIGLEDAAKQLGATKDQLNALREAGEIRAYRDGASWKFRSEDIDELAASGGLSAPAPGDSDAGLDAFGGDLNSGSIDLSDDLELDLGSLDISDDLTGEAEQAEAPLPLESDLDLAGDDEPTTPADEDEAALPASGDDELVLDDEPISSDAESILLTDASVGGAPGRPPSTIIGKNDIDSEDADLELASDSGVGPATSDVRLVDEDLDDVTAGAAVGQGPSDAASKFEGLEELEIDLEAESSRILESKDLEAARAAAAKESSDAADEGSRPEIDALDSDLSLASGGSDEASLTGLSQLGGGDGFELAPDSSLVMQNEGGSDEQAEEKSPGSSAVLSDDANDDFVLGGEGSDITLSGADSGINLVPSDSGIALDDASLDLSGAGSSLDLSESFGAALTDGEEESIVSAEVSGEQDFLLQPVADESDMEDSSQIIALEEVGEEEDDVMISDDVSAFDTPVGAAAPAGAVAAVEETQFDLWAMLFLSAAVLTMLVCAVMSVDMIRTIWSWDEPSSISSGILKSVGDLWGFRS